MSVCATLDLFGVHPIAPAASFDVMGLIPVPRGDRARVDCEKKDGSATAFVGPLLRFSRSKLTVGRRDRRDARYSTYL